MAKKSTQPLGPFQLEWLEALESGKFEQGSDFLRSADDKFCCLGVACELSGVKAVLMNRSGITRYEYLGERHYLPKEIVDKLKFRDNDGSGGLSRSIAQLNDEGKTFKEIAATVRANPSKYFTAPA